jgi:hypothetical protein
MLVGKLGPDPAARPIGNKHFPSVIWEKAAVTLAAEGFLLSLLEVVRMKTEEKDKGNTAERKSVSQGVQSPSQSGKATGGQKTELTDTEIANIAVAAGGEPPPLEITPNP